MAGTQDQPSTSPGEPPPSDQGRRFWLIPLVTFLVGLVLGGGILAIVRPSSTTPSVAAPPSGESPTAGPSQPSSSPTSGPVTIPGECVQVATDSQQLLDLVDQAVQSIRDLDAKALSTIVSELQAQQDTVRSQVSDCQSAVASASPSPS